MYGLKLLVIVGFTFFILAATFIMWMGYMIVSPSGQGGFRFAFVILAGLAALDFFLIRRFFYSENKKTHIKLKTHDAKDEKHDEDIY